MKKYLLFLLFALSNSFFAQKIQYKLQKSEVFRDDFKNTNIVLSDKNSKGETILVRSYSGTMISQGNGFYIEKYDTKLKLIQEYLFDLKHPTYQKFNLIVGIFQMENNLHFVEIYFDLNEKMYVCFDNMLSESFEVSKKELFRFSKEEFKNFGVFNLQNKFYSRANEDWMNDNEGVFNSENEQKNLNVFNNLFFSGNNGKYNYSNVYWNEKQVGGSDILLTVNQNKSAFAIAIDFFSKENDALKLYLFDNKLEKKLDLMYGTELNEKKCFFQNIQVSDDGNAIFLLSKSYTKDLKNKEEGGKYYYEYSKITSKSQITERVDTNEHFIGSLKSYFHNDELISIGFYSDDIDFNYSGIYCLKMDVNTLQVKSSNYNPFTSQFLLDKYGNDKKKALKNIKFKSVHFTNENDMIINAEEVYISSQLNNSSFSNNSLNRTSGSTINFHSTASFPHLNFDDIIIAKLNFEGALIWARNINKKQSTTNENNSAFLSYTSSFKNEKAYFFINAKEEIKKIKNDRIEFGQIRKNKSNLNIIQVDTNGDFEYEEILDDEENAVPFMVSKGVTIDNAVYFLGRRGSDKQLLKVTL
jgi:hypothetical protein